VQYGQVSSYRPHHHCNSLLTRHAVGIVYRLRSRLGGSKIAVTRPQSPSSPTLRSQAGHLGQVTSNLPPLLLPTNPPPVGIVHRLSSAHRYRQPLPGPQTSHPCHALFWFTLFLVLLVVRFLTVTAFLKQREQASCPQSDPSERRATVVRRGLGGAIFAPVLLLKH
jgi:hypothetical protein